MKYRIAIVGQREAVQGFALLGLDVIPYDGTTSITDVLLGLKRAMQLDEQGTERNLYAIVFVTEDLAGDLPLEDQRRLARGALPAIIPVPSHRGTTGFGLKRLTSIVEQAIGSDILT